MPTIAYVSRTESFSAAHRLHSHHLTEEENRTLYGKCNYPNFHGHNYKVEVTIRGEVDIRTGMVINISDLKECIKVAVMDELDHRNLDLDVPFFSSHLYIFGSTTENLAIFIWKNFQRHLALLLPTWSVGKTAQLYEIRLHETDRNVVVFRGEGLEAEDSYGLPLTLVSQQNTSTNE